MNKIIFILIFCVSVSIAQENRTDFNQENKIEFNRENEEISVEDFLFNIYISPSGFVIDYEFKLTNRISFKTELLAHSFKMGIIINSHTESHDISFFASSYDFSIEPRFYYDLDNALKKNEGINQNPGKYLSLKTSISTLYDSYEMGSSVIETVIIAGVRKIFTKYFSGEIGIGAGIGVFRNQSDNPLTVYLALSAPLRIGLTL